MISASTSGLSRDARWAAFISIGACVPLRPDDVPTNDPVDAAIRLADSSQESTALIDDGPAAEANDERCGDRCKQGAIRCSLAENTQEICLIDKESGCLTWRFLGACATTDVCCDGACVPNDDAHCYSCNGPCRGATPVCVHELRRCGCTSPLCAKQAKVCNALKSECALPEPGIGYFVDATAAPAGDGTITHPFRTITAALDTADDQTDVVRIQVAPGTYDAGLGERFPLVVRRGIWLEGSGPSQSTIRGVGNYHAAVRPNAYDGVLFTIVLGDPDELSRLAGFTLEPGPGLFTELPSSILCDQGNAAPAGIVTSEPNSDLRDLSIGSGYRRGIIVSAGGSGDIGGCNLRLTDSVIQSAMIGLLAVGCTDFDPRRATQVAFELGTGTAANRNVFQSQRANDASGVAVSVKACVGHFIADNNMFSGADVAIHVEQPQRIGGLVNHFTLRNNTFQRLSRTGLLLAGAAAVVDELTANTFSEISSGSSSAFVGAGVSIEGVPSESAGFARIAKAHGNTFESNDVAVRVVGNSTTGLVLDFGTAAVPGENVFRCNSRSAGTNPPGGDVVIDLPFAPGNVFAFSGNIWDHEVPTRATFANRFNGADWTVRAADSIPLFDDQNAHKGSAECQPGRIP